MLYFIDVTGLKFLEIKVKCVLDVSRVSSVLWEDIMQHNEKNFYSFFSNIKTYFRPTLMFFFVFFFFTVFTVKFKWNHFQIITLLSKGNIFI